mgnify:CR=1 FL=1
MFTIPTDFRVKRETDLKFLPARVLFQIEFKFKYYRVVLLHVQVRVQLDPVSSYGEL